MACALTSCGADRNNDRYDGSYYDSHDYGRDGRTSAGNSAEDHVKDAVDGVKDAGKDVADGAGNAVNDVIDGLDGDVERDAHTSRTSSATTMHTTRR